VLKSPGDAALWTGFGMKLADNDHGVSPAARLAFDKAIALWPQHPGPPFFLGLAYVQSWDFVSARPFWARAVALTPESLSYRQVLMAQLDWLDRMIAAQAEQAARQQEIQAAPPSR
jgi:cytochrome c-type biogenesis protein CcmH/NrfG